MPVLLYRGTCPRCRFLSRAVVAISGFAIHRIANDTAAAAAIYARHGQPAGKLALVHRGRIHVGRQVFAVAWQAIASCWMARIPWLGRRYRRAAHKEVGV
jgi:predicted DCC family thiol-disulfide oxidoreductase YuxK